MENMKEGCCCDALDYAVRKGMVKHVNIIDHAPEYNTYYIESVIKKDTTRFMWIWESLVVDTEDIILKYCPFCSKELGRDG